MRPRDAPTAWKPQLRWLIHAVSARRTSHATTLCVTSITNAKLNTRIARRVLSFACLLLLMSVLVGAVLLAAAWVPDRFHAGRGPLAAAVIALCGAFTVTVGGDVDSVTGVSLIFATSLIVVITAFSRRHLDGDPQRLRYNRWLLWTSGAAVLSLSGTDLLLVAAAWVLTGAGLSVLVGHHREAPATVAALRGLRRARIVGDAALLLGFTGLAWAAGGTSFSAVTTWAAANPDSPILLMSGTALLLAAAARCGLLPFSRWVPLSVVAPAPVSALLHAGVVNAPIILLIQLAPVWQPGSVLRPVMLAVGLITAVATFPRLLVRADVKTRLAWSTTAQLGFVLALLAVGASAAALLHVVLHGIYKANAFLGAGDQISRARRDGLAPTGRLSRVIGATAGAVAGAGLLVADRAAERPLTAVTVMIAFTAGGWGLTSVRASLPARLGAGAICVAAAAGILALAHVAAPVLGLPLAADGTLAQVAAAVMAAFAVGSVLLLAVQPTRAWAVLHRLADPVVPARIRRAPAPAPVVARPDLHHLIREGLTTAAGAVAPAWGWKAFTATNPLLGAQERSFTTALEEAVARRQLVLPGLQPPGPGGDIVDDLVAGWLAVWSNQGPTPWPAPLRDLGLWEWFRCVAVADPVFARRTRPWLRELPACALDMIAAGLPAAALQLDPFCDWARTELLRLPGWAGYLSRRGTPAASVDHAVLLDLLAVRAATRQAFGLPTPPLQPGAEPDRAQSRSSIMAAVQETVSHMERTETHLRQQLLAQLTTAPVASSSGVSAGNHNRPDADLVFCIDVRSEPLRRHVESAGRYRTAGYAGFFGLAVQRSCASSTDTDRFPVLLTAAARVHEAPPGPARTGDLVTAALRQALDLPGAGFAAVDVAALRALLASVRVLWPRTARAHRQQTRALTWSAEDERALVDAALQMMRATALHGPGTAPVVLLVGHGSTSTNNPAESAFDCGACGGSRGAFNARVAADVLNSTIGRTALADAGLGVPEDTTFVAAEHDTALDQVIVLEPHTVPSTHRQALAGVLADLSAAGQACAAERCASLPGAAHVTGAPRRASRHVRRRALDPAEVRHEWGLAGNAFFIAAPRALTAATHLQGRAFLHEYVPANDPDAGVLETILTAPLVVAHWINSQYLFSATDPERLGAGSKTAHNPVGALGVLAGPGGDLRTGLGEQSVRYDGVPFQPPTRLLAIVAASTERIDSIVSKHPTLAHLVTSGWMTLCALDPQTGLPLLRTTIGWAAPDDATAHREAIPHGVPAPTS